MTLLDAAAAAGLFAALIALSIIDARSFLLPDRITLPLIAGGLLYAWLSGLSLWPYAIGAAVGYGAFVALEVGYLKLRGRDGLGRGDAKLLAAAGAWCGWDLLPFIVLLAALAGLLFIALQTITTKAALTAQTQLPFGPFLALGFAVVWIAERVVVFGWG